MARWIKFLVWRWCIFLGFFEIIVLGIVWLSGTRPLWFWLNLIAAPLVCVYSFSQLRRLRAEGATRSLSTWTGGRNVVFILLSLATGLYLISLPLLPVIGGILNLALYGFANRPSDRLPGWMLLDGFAILPGIVLVALWLVGLRLTRGRTAVPVVHDRAVLVGAGWVMLVLSAVVIGNHSIKPPPSVDRDMVTIPGEQLAQRALAKVQRKADWDRITVGWAKGTEYHLKLVYRNAPSDVHEAEEDTTTIARAIVSEIVASGADTSAQLSYVYVWAECPREEADRKWMDDCASTEYNFRDNQFKVAPGMQ